MGGIPSHLRHLTGKVSSSWPQSMHDDAAELGRHRTMPKGVHGTHQLRARGDRRRQPGFANVLDGLPLSCPMNRNSAEPCVKTSLRTPMDNAQRELLCEDNIPGMHQEIKARAFLPHGAHPPGAHVE